MEQFQFERYFQYFLVSLSTSTFLGQLIRAFPVLRPWGIFLYLLSAVAVAIALNGRLPPVVVALFVLPLIAGQILAWGF